MVTLGVVVVVGGGLVVVGVGVVVRVDVEVVGGGVVVDVVSVSVVVEVEVVVVDGEVVGTAHGGSVPEPLGQELAISLQSSSFQASPGHGPSAPLLILSLRIAYVLSSSTQSYQCATPATHPTLHTFIPSFSTIRLM